jgi:hypothetical protein
MSWFFASTDLLVLLLESEDRGDMLLRNISEFLWNCVTLQLRSSTYTVYKININNYVKITWFMDFD